MKKFMWEVTMKNFYEIEDLEIVSRTKHFFIAKDKYPVTDKHLLVISKSPFAEDYFDLNDNELDDLPKAIKEAQRMILTFEGNEHTGSINFPVVMGYNIGMNCGKVAGQTIMHFHCHVIPRYKGDMDDPRGGVRHVIPEKGNYLKDEDSYTPLECTCCGGKFSPQMIEEIFCRFCDNVRKKNE